MQGLRIEPAANFFRRNFGDLRAALPSSGLTNAAIALLNFA
jgi:hypothetical protein